MARPSTIVVHSWKAGPGEVLTVENLFIYSLLNLHARYWLVQLLGSFLYPAWQSHLFEQYSTKLLSSYIDPSRI